MKAWLIHLLGGRTEAEFQRAIALLDATCQMPSFCLFTKVPENPYFLQEGYKPAGYEPKRQPVREESFGKCPEMGPETDLRLKNPVLEP